MREIDIPGYGVKAFPSDMSDDEVRSIIDENFPGDSLPQNEPSILDSIAKSAGTQFVLGAGDKFSNVFRNISNYVSPNSMHAPLIKSGEGAAYDIGEIPGEIAAYMAAATPAGGILRAAEYLPAVGSIATKLAGRLAQGVSGTPLSATAPSVLSETLGGGAGLARRGIGGAAYGSSQSPDDRLGGAGEMAAASVASDALTGGLGKLIPGNLLSKSSFPTEIIQQNLRAAKGTETGLGSVIGNRIMQRVEDNTLPSIPFTGAADSQAVVASRIKAKGEDILNQYSHGVEKQNVNKEIAAELKKSADEQSAYKTKLFSKPNKEAENLKLRVEAQNLKAETEKYKKAIDESDLFLFSPVLKSTLNKAISTGKGLDAAKGGLSLKKAGILRGELGGEANRYKNSIIPADKNKGTMISDLHKALTQDIESNLSSWAERGHPGIKEGYYKAQANYSENYAPFLDKEIHNFTSGSKDVDKLVSTFVKKGMDNDNPGQVQKLMSKLSDKGQDLVKFSYLSKALQGDPSDVQKKTLNPKFMQTLLGDNKLGADQKLALFNKPGEAQQMNDYAKLVSMNEKAISRMVNLETGQSAKDVSSPVAAGSVGAAIGAILGEAFGIGGTAGAAIGGFSAFPISASANSALRNEKIRERVANSIIKNRERSIKPGDATKYIRRFLTPSIEMAVSDALKDE